MRSEREIWEKIDSLSECKGRADSKELEENICFQIDMLLWVVGDESGAKPLDEQIKGGAI